MSELHRSAYSLALVQILKSQPHRPVPAAELKTWEPANQAHRDRIRQLQVAPPTPRP